MPLLVAQPLPGYSHPLELLNDSSFSGKEGDVSPEKNFPMRMMQIRLRNAEAKNNPRIAAWVAAKIGSVFASRNDGDSALFYFKKSAAHFDKADMPAAEGAVLTASGILLERKKDFMPALDHFQDATDRFDVSGFKRGLFVVHLWKAKIYEALKYDSKALDELLAATKFLPPADPGQRADLFNRIGEEYIHLANDQASLDYFNEALDIYGKQGDKKGKAMVFRNLGIVHFKSGKYQEALAFFQHSLVLDENINTMRLLRDCLLKLYAFNKLNKDEKQAEAFNSSYKIFKDSVEYLINSRALSPDSFAKELEQKIYITDLLNRKGKLEDPSAVVPPAEYSQKLTETELQRLKTEEALARINQEHVEDQVANRERQERIQQLEREKAMQGLAIANQQLRESRQWRLINILGSAFLIILTGLGFMYWRYRSKKKSHATLDIAYSELRNTHKKLEAAQDHLVHAAKMASLGQMTAGIAHEIQNPLNFVNNFAESTIELIQEMDHTGNQKNQGILLEEIRLNLSKIIQHGKRADSIVKNMLQHSRSGVAEKEATDLNKLITDYLQLAYHGFRAKNPEFHCEIITSFDRELPAVGVIVQDFSRVLLNLFNNAFFAVNKPPAGSQKPGIHHTPQIQVSTLRLNRYVTIVVRDNGPGVSPELHEKIFQPFFTTKPTGEGTGLGLSLSYDIIKAHGGELTLKSEPGEGAVFTILLPV